jgi:SET family sugar efflux transporter-like MFS transporter
MTTLTAERPETAVRIVARNPFFRSAFLALFIAGIGFSATLPQLTLFLTRDLHASVPVAGLYFLTNLSAPVAGFAVGLLSDRQPDRLRLVRVSAVVGGVGWLAMAGATRIWMPFVISVVALSISGATMALLFAAVRDELSRRPTPADSRVVATVRMAFTAGWIIGPVFGSWFGSAFGLRPLLVATALCCLGQLVPLGRQRVARFPATPAGADGEPVRRSWRRLAPLLVFTGLSVLVMSGDTMKFAYLPIYMADDLHVSDTLRGAVIAVQPLLEFALMPLAAWCADRIGPVAVLAAAAVLAATAHVAYATSTGVAALFLGQGLTACAWAAIAGLGVTVAQQLYPEGVGLASGVFLSALTTGAALGGVVGSLGVASLGLPHVFFLPAAFAALGAFGLLVLHRRSRSGRQTARQ